MCGIAGFSDRNKAKEEIIKSMTDKLVHRGPDDSGFYVDEDIALGHRRLSIIDLEICSILDLYSFFRKSSASLGISSIIEYNSWKV